MQALKPRSDQKQELAKLMDPTLDYDDKSHLLEVYGFDAPWMTMIQINCTTHIANNIYRRNSLPFDDQIALAARIKQIFHTKPPTRKASQEQVTAA